MPQIPITIDAAHVTPETVANWTAKLALAEKTLQEGSGAGAEFRGWLDPSQMVTDAEVEQIQQIADDLRAKSEMLVIGIGGSYLGARAVTDALGTAAGIDSVKFAGNSLSARYHKDLLESLVGKKVALNVVSKSGTMTEPAIAFRLLRNLVESQAGKDAAKDLIVATTDTKKGALRKVAVEVGYKTLPIAYASIDIRALRQGAID